MRNGRATIFRDLDGFIMDVGLGPDRLPSTMLKTFASIATTLGEAKIRETQQRQI